MKKINFICAGLVFSGLFIQGCASTSGKELKATKKVQVEIDFSAPVKNISPYIYGINDGINLRTVKPGSIRLGGNRMTAYNWETNKSNAGTDWVNSSDDYMINSVRPQFRRSPGAAALEVSKDAEENNVPYTLLTLQMAGYVANKDGKMTVDNALDGEDWCKVENHKGSEFSLNPDKNDGVVYTDEYLNYLGTFIGKSDSKTGFKGYALDNEPALWQHTHPLIQRTPIMAEELIKKSVDLASTVKEFDPGAEVFGPSLFGYSAYDSLGGDWSLIKSRSLFRYNWFIDYYLEKMKEAGEEKGCRLLDVLDIHYYTEAKGACGKRKCNHYDNDDCIKARINAVRSLYDPKYREKSWITDTGARHFPLLPKIYDSINNFYPGTKLAFTEYDFGGGNDITGAIAQTEFLRVLAEYEVYFATIWSFDKNLYQMSAINMFTNYDGKGSSFGNKLISSVTSDDYAVSSIVSLSDNDDNLRIILTNKEIHDNVKVSVDLKDKAYNSAVKYVLDGKSFPIYENNDNMKLKNGVLTVTLPPLTVNHIVISKQN